MKDLQEAKKSKFSILLGLLQSGLSDCCRAGLRLCGEDFPVGRKLLLHHFVMEMLSSVCSFENIWEPVFERDFSAKPEQENLGELKQELDVDFHKVLNIISFRFILYQGS